MKQQVNGLKFVDNCVRLLIDVCEGERFEGRICGIALSGEIPFSNNVDFIVKVDKAFDLIGKPQSGQVPRSFDESSEDWTSYVGAPERFHTSEDIAGRFGRLATVDLTMITRHRSEWQGKLTDAAGKTIEVFDSAVGCYRQIAALCGEGKLIGQAKVSD